MKKYLVILLSLALVFCFISCDGSTKTPDGSNGSSSSPVVPEDPNVPDESKFITANKDDSDIILSAISRFMTDDAIHMAEYDETTEYTIPDNTEINIPGESQLPISGIFTIIGKYSYDEIERETAETYNGTITIGEDEYVLSDIVSYEHGYHDSLETTTSLTGSYKKNGERIEISDVSKLEESEPGLYAFLFNFPSNLSNKPTPTNENLSNTIIHKVETSSFKGRCSIEMSGNDSHQEATLKTSIDNDGKGHKLTGKMVASANDKGGSTIDIEYFSIDGVYFKPESIEGNEYIMKALMMLFGKSLTSKT